MAIRFLTTSAAILLLAGPAFADCSQEIESLKQAVTEAETGASTAESGMPATKHQEQVLKGDQQGDKAASGDAAAGQAGVPASPHQEQVLAEPAAGGALPQDNRRPTSSLRRATWPQRATRKAACRKSLRQRIFSASTRQAVAGTRGPTWLAAPRSCLPSARARVIAAAFSCRNVPCRRAFDRLQRARRRCRRDCRPASFSALSRTRAVSKRRRWILGTLGAVAVLLIGALILFDWNWLKGPIESQVSGRLGRPFRIHGDLDVDLSLQPRITIEGAELGNAPWGSDAPMAKIDRVEVTVDLLKLVQGEIVLPEVRIAQPDLLLETRPDGPPNWQFGEAEETSPGPPALPRIDRLEISDASVRYHDLGSGRNLTADLTRIAGRTDPGLKLNATGKVQGEPLDLEITGAALAQLENGAEPYPASLALKFGQSDLRGDLTLDLFKEVPAIRAKLASDRVVTTDFTALSPTTAAASTPRLRSLPASRSVRSTKCCPKPARRARRRRLRSKPAACCSMPSCSTRSPSSKVRSWRFGT